MFRVLNILARRKNGAGGPLRPAAAIVRVDKKALQSHNVGPTIDSNVVIVNQTTGQYYRFHNTITDVHREQYANALIGTAVTYPGFIAVGNTAKLNTESGSAFTLLKSEIDRLAVTSSALQASDVARFVAVFQSGDGNGEINELGLFSAGHSVVAVDAMDAVGDWTTSGALTQDTVTYREGTASVRNTVTGTGSQLTAFQKTTFNLDVTNAVTEANTYLQMWYWVNTDTSPLASGVTPTMIDGASVLVRCYTGGSNYYEWALATTGTDRIISTGPNWLNLRFSAATKSGSPDIVGANLTRITILSTPDNTVVVRELLDRIRVFVPAGNLWARVDLPTTVTKEIATTAAVYWFLAMRAGGAVENYNAYAFERLTVSTSSTALTASSYNPNSVARPGQPARQAWIVIRSGGPINWTLDGTTPTSTVGNGPWYAGSSFMITGYTDIAAFRAIRTSLAADDATLEITYLR